MTDTLTRNDDVCALVTAACALVERCAGAHVRDRTALGEAVLLAAELSAIAETVADDALADDAAGAAAELDELIARLDALPPLETRALAV